MDSSPLTRLGLRCLLDHEYRDLVFGEAQHGEGALAQIAKQPWKLVLLEFSPADNDTFRVLEHICRFHPGLGVLAMSPHADLHSAQLARQMGATGYARKDAGRAEFLRAFRSVLNGKKHFDRLTAPAKVHPASKKLSPREYRVMVALAEGRRATDIASELDLSIKTVSTYKRRILNKLQITSTADLVRYVISRSTL